jgi:hypothetical protein
MEYYVYAYLRQSDGTPYYIGKGKKYRAWDSVEHRKHGISTPKDKSYIILLETELTQIGAAALERRMIAWYGRLDKNDGILRNKTDGGDGGSGIIYSEEHRNRMRQAKLGKKQKPSHVKNMVDAISQEWIVTVPSGEEMKIKNLANFARDHGLTSSCLYRVSTGERNSHKGYFVKPI